MKILVISDVHGCFDALYKICKLENPDMVLFSGDGSEDVRQMSYVFKEIKFISVKGNCDYYDSNKDEEIINIMGKKFFLTHGHIYGVKRDYSSVEKRGKELGADIIVFGHTHIPYLKEKENIVLFNPGAVLSKSYGVISIEENKKIIFKHKEID